MLKDKTDISSAERGGNVGDMGMVPVVIGELVVVALAETAATSMPVNNDELAVFTLAEIAGSASGFRSGGKEKLAASVGTGGSGEAPPGS